MIRTNLLAKDTARLLAVAGSARVGQHLNPVRFLGAAGVRDPGKHFANYANMISSRIITLYDDCSLLLDNQRVPAACALSRSVLETYAVGEFALFEVGKAFASGGLEKAGAVVLAYVNSSRVKAEEQKRFKAKTFSASDYHFTPAALARMAKEEGAAKHIMNAMRHLFKREMEVTGGHESNFELLYEQLSEWTHPSQTSLFHAFAEETWMVETSVGPVSLWDAARNASARALHFITAVPDLVERMNEAAAQLSAVFENKATT